MVKNNVLYTQTPILIPYFNMFHVKRVSYETNKKQYPKCCNLSLKMCAARETLRYLTIAEPTVPRNLLHGETPSFPDPLLVRFSLLPFK